MSVGVDKATVILERCEKEYPKSALFLFFNAKIHRLKVSYTATTTRVNTATTTIRVNTLTLDKDTFMSVVSAADVSLTHPHLCRL